MKKGYDNFYKRLKRGIIIGNIPQSQQLILPSIDLLQNRISIFVYELESTISDEFYPSQHPLTQIKYIGLYKPIFSSKFATKSIIKGVLCFLYVYSFPILNVNDKIKVMKQKMMLIFIY